MAVKDIVFANQKNRPFGLWFVILHNFYIGVFSWLLIA